MPAFLTRDGEPLVQGMPPVSEQIRCTKDGGEISYTLRSDIQVSMHGTEKNTDVMNRMALARIQGGHPSHSTREFYWRGPVDGWRESDTVAQRKEL